MTSTLMGDAAATGHFVDVNALGQLLHAATGTGDARPLFDSTAAGAARGERLFQAIGMAFKDYEPDFMYMLTSSLRTWLKCVLLTW